MYYEKKKKLCVYLGFRAEKSYALAFSLNESTWVSISKRTIILLWEPRTWLWYQSLCGRNQVAFDETKGSTRKVPRVGSRLWGRPGLPPPHRIRQSADIRLPGRPVSWWTLQILPKKARRWDSFLLFLLFIITEKMGWDALQIQSMSFKMLIFKGFLVQIIYHNLWVKSSAISTFLISLKTYEQN